MLCLPANVQPYFSCALGGGELYCRDRPARPQRRNDKARGVKGFMEYRGCEGAQHIGPMVLCRYKHDEPLSSP